MTLAPEASPDRAIDRAEKQRKAERLANVTELC
jgi:hypothetical protein